MLFVLLIQAAQIGDRRELFADLQLLERLDKAQPIIFHPLPRRSRSSAITLGNQRAKLHHRSHRRWTLPAVTMHDTGVV